MSGSGPVRTSAGLPAPRPVPEDPGAAAASELTAAHAPHGRSDRHDGVDRHEPDDGHDRTEQHDVLVGDPGVGAEPEVELDEQALLAELMQPRTAGSSGSGSGAPELTPAAVGAPGTDTGRRASVQARSVPERPASGLTRSASIWLWLWGPLLVAVVVVSFLAGMASAPVVLPSSSEARPAVIADVRGRSIATVAPPTAPEASPDLQVPELVLRSVVAVQDPAYFDRRSLSAADLLAAGAADLVRVRRHGDTIEERYARQVRVAAGSDVPSLRESTIAVRLSQQLSRRALLTRYVNGMYFGNGVYGVSAAARFWFGSPLASLDPGQIAMLVTIGDDPAAHNPVTAADRTAAARGRTVDAMRVAGVIDDAQLTAARRPVTARPHRQLEAPSAAPEFAALVQSALFSRFGDDGVYRQALQVATPLDLDLQAALSGSVRRLVPGGAPPVLAVATDPRTGDVRALLNRGTASAGSPSGAADVLFTRRPLGTLAPVLPVKVGDGGSASVGEVAAALASVAADGVIHDLRAVSSVTRPARSGRAVEVVDAADPMPPGRQLLPREAAAELTAGFRSTTRRSATGEQRLRFDLAGAGGEAGGASWYVGCVPDLCITVWTGAPAPTAAPAPTDSSRDPGPGAAPGLARSLVAATFTDFVTAAPGRIDLPALPVARPATPRPVEAPREAAEDVRATVPEPQASPAPPRATPSAEPRPTTAPTPRAEPVATPTPSASPSAAPDPDGANGEPPPRAQGPLSPGNASQRAGD